ncbi:MAG: transposase [Opitutales bacterium]|nr:transposase [Opitutales bacterium]
MKSPWQGTIVGIWYDTHPHWVVDYGCYAVTLRCRGSLPVSTRKQLLEIGRTLRTIEPASPQAEALRRRHFRILENTLDAGQGPLPFTGPAAAEMHQWIAGYNHENLTFAHWVIMPNHLHLLTSPRAFEDTEGFQTTWRRFKGRSSRFVNQVIDRNGPLWQDSLYDRWVRDEAEYKRWIDYIRKNPVRARLATEPAGYAYLR